MASENQETWWRRTKALAVATLGGAVIVGLFLLVLSPFLDRLTPFSLPLGYFLVAEGLPPTPTPVPPCPEIACDLDVDLATPTPVPVAVDD